MDKDKLAITKLIARYVIIAFVCYLAYTVSAASYINEIAADKAGLLKITTGSIFASLAIIIKYHFETKPE